MKTGLILLLLFFLFLFFFRFLHLALFLIIRYWYIFAGLIGVYFLFFKRKKRKDMEDNLDPDKELNIKPEYKVEDYDE